MAEGFIVFVKRRNIALKYCTGIVKLSRYLTWEVFEISYYSFQVIY